jgi:hypothetical protein
MKTGRAIMSLILILATTSVARAETGLLDRRLAAPMIARFSAERTEDGRVVVRTESDEREDQVPDDSQIEDLRIGWRRPAGRFGDLLSACTPIAPPALADDGFDAILCERLGSSAVKVFLDAPPSLTGDDGKPLGARIEPNRVDDYFLTDDCVTVGFHEAFGRLWLDEGYCANVYGIMGMDARKILIERPVLARREPNRTMIRAAYALDDARRVELFGQVAAEQPLETGRFRPGFQVGIRGVF